MGHGVMNTNEGEKEEDEEEEVKGCMCNVEGERQKEGRTELWCKED